MLPNKTLDWVNDCRKIIHLINMKNNPTYKEGDVGTFELRFDKVDPENDLSLPNWVLQKKIGKNKWKTVEVFGEYNKKFNKVERKETLDKLNNMLKGMSLKD